MENQESREYHVFRHVQRNTGACSFHWVRTDGLLNTAQSPISWNSRTECVENLRANAKRIGVKPLIIY